MSTSPYENLPKRQFWRPAVAEDHVLTTSTLWNKKFHIGQNDNIASAGSCFAQHISKRLVKSGYNFIDAEQAPPQLPADEHARFGYGIYSARYGNIYTTAQLRELAEEALGMRPSLDYSWEKEGRFYDPLRPNVEPKGLESHEEVMFHRKYHLEKVHQVLTTCDIFVFTLGLTEAWVCNRTGRTLPTAPGTVAGSYSPDLYSFQNYKHEKIKSDFIKFMELVRSVQTNRNCRFLLTVSPVPLTATATDNHVLVATTYSKSTLRSVAGDLYSEYDNIDYFPSYEIIASHWSRGIFFETNMRSVSSSGVDAAMRVFFLEHELTPNTKVEPKVNQVEDKQRPHVQDNDVDNDVVCEEALLEGFAK